MKGSRTLLAILVLSGVITLGMITNAPALESGEFAALYDAGQYELLVSMCNANASQIASHPDSATIQGYCAQAQAALGGSAPPPATMPTTPPPDTGTSSDDIFEEDLDVPDDTPADVPSTPGKAPGKMPSSAPPPPPSTPTTRPSLTMAPSKVNVDLFTQPLQAQEYDSVISLCDKYSSQIANHPDRDQILKACGQAKVGSFNKSKKMTDLTGAISDYEDALKNRYSNNALFDLGKSRIQTLDTVPKGEEKRDTERKGILEMWEAIVMQHALENFNPAVSDQIIIWTIGNPTDDKDNGYVDILIERVIKDEKDLARQRWLAARVRMLADRFYTIDPNLGETETRQQNLEVVKGWMVELMEKSYFDNNILVGMMTYKADRHEENYVQNDETESQFHKSLYFYDEARKRAKSNKAMAVLHQKIGYLCSRYRSENKKRLVEFYKKGFLHSRKGLQLMRSVNARKMEAGKYVYRYEEDNSEVTSNLQKAYGNNLTGYIYNLYLEKKFKGVVGLKKQTLDVGFDWENKSDVLLLFAESAKELAAQSTKDDVNYRKYKEMTLAAGSRAFKFVLKKYQGSPPPVGDETFCKVFNSYWNYLDAFGQLVQRKSLDNKYGKYCPTGGGAPVAAE